MSNIEIERKWLVKGYPDNLKLLFIEEMKQGYIQTSPTVRIREENLTFTSDLNRELKDNFVLCFKSKGGLARKEIEIDISEDKFNDLKDLIGLPLINKTRKTYLLSNGYHLEVNHVDKGLDSEFYYAEIEFPSIEKANLFDAKEVNLENYLSNEVTNKRNESMAAYWKRTRLNSEK